MQTNELWELVRKLGQGGEGEQESAAALLRGVRTPESSLTTDVQRLAALHAPVRSSEPAVPAPRTTGDSANSGDSTATSVLKTVGMVSGVGPLVTGLMKLFGSGGGETSAPPELTPYSLPQSVSVEAGLAGDRSFVPLSYSQSGSARPAGERSSSTGSATQIHVNVQAMDSRSFLDHSDEIARAVREAMLRSHSLNDVVSEL
jgi:hypothetical protein